MDNVRGQALKSSTTATPSSSRSRPTVPQPTSMPIAGQSVTAKNSKADTTPSHPTSSYGSQPTYHERYRLLMEAFHAHPGNRESPPESRLCNTSPPDDTTSNIVSAGTAQSDTPALGGTPVNNNPPIEFINKALWTGTRRV